MKSCIIRVFASLATCGAAVSATAQDVPPPVAAAPTLKAETVVAEVAAAYARGPLAERVAITVSLGGARDRESTIVWRTDRGDESAGSLRRTRLELGRLVVAIDGTTLRASTTQNPKLYFQHTFAGPVTPESLSAILPDIPLPQLHWALGAGSSGPIPLIGEVTWQSVEQSARDRITCRGATDRGEVNLVCEAENKRIVVLEGPLAGTQGEAPRIRLACAPLDAGEPSSWRIETAGREVVSSLTELRPRVGEIAPGSRIPALGLMTADLSLWPLQDAIAAAADPHGDGAAFPVAAVLVLYRPVVAAATEDARGAVVAAMEHRRELDRRRVMGEALGRFILQPVGVLDLGEVGQTEQFAGQWLTDDQLPPSLWTSAGREMIERFVPGASSAMLVIDADQRLIAVVPLDGRVQDRAGLAQDLAAALARAWGLNGAEAPQKEQGPEQESPSPSPK